MSTSASSGLVCIDLGISIYTQRHCNALCCAALCGVHTDSVLLDTIHPFVLIDPFVPIYPFVLCRTTQRTRSCSCVRLWWCACLAQQAPPPPYPPCVPYPGIALLLVFPTQRICEDTVSILEYRPRIDAHACARARRCKLQTAHRVTSPHSDARACLRACRRAADGPGRLCVDFKKSLNSKKV